MLAECTLDMTVMCDEVFGQDLPIQLVDGLQEAIAYANDSLTHIQSK